MKSILDIAFPVMDKCQVMIQDGRVSEGMAYLIAELKQIRDSYSTKEWAKFAGTQFLELEHTLKDLILQEPYTRHSFDKPRGYAGDAGLLDFAYGDCQLPQNTSPIGTNLYKFLYNDLGMTSLRNRRDIMTAKIDELSLTFPNNYRILSVACGHLRESEASLAIKENRVQEFIALDRDRLSLDFITEKMLSPSISPICGSVQDLLDGKIVFDNLSFIYSVGLYDYLPQFIARRLTKILFDMLVPGGQLLIANAYPSVQETAYMETFMQWRLIYREEAEMNDLAFRIDLKEIERKRCFWDELNYIIFVEIIKS